jgi:hypothetical protein
VSECCLRVDRVLGYLRYYDKPELLQVRERRCSFVCVCVSRMRSYVQEAIRQIYKAAHTQVKIDGAEVVGFPMFEALDGTNSSHYVSGAAGVRAATG